MPPTLNSIVTGVPIDQGYEAMTSLVGKSKPIWDYGCKIQSQNEEDGNIYYILSAIGVKTKTTFEVCAGDGIECNSANLILYHGFKGYLLDGNQEAINNGIAFYKNKGCLDRVQYLNGWITKENISAFVDAVNLRGKEVDVLIMDIDGNDYWILKEIMDNNMLNPRVIVVEYQDIIGPERALTIPYDPTFIALRHDIWNGPNYCGASLQAFIHLLKDKYAFVGCERLGFNGYFVRRDELAKSGDMLHEMTDVTPCFQHEKVQFGMKYRWPRTSHMEWIDVVKATDA